MGKNRSSAVMARRIEPRDSLDDFPTPPWGTRALIEHVLIGHGWRRDQLAAQTVWEPAANRGFMARPLAEYFGSVVASDVHDYGAGFVVDDFLLPCPRLPAVDWIITNPPFRLAAEFALRGLEIARQGVALLVRTAFAEGIERYETLFKPHPPLMEAVFCERLPMVKGRVDPKAVSATSYSWIVWPGRDFKRADLTTRRLWIPACRRELERPGDYPADLQPPEGPLPLIEAAP